MLHTLLSSLPSFLLAIPCFHTNLVTPLVTRETSELVVIPLRKALTTPYFHIVCRLNVEGVQRVLPSQLNARKK